MVVCRRIPSGTVAVVALTEALADAGTRGDRNAATAGTFSPADSTRPGYDLTPFEAGALGSLSLPGDNPTAGKDARRNVERLTTGASIATLDRSLGEAASLRCAARLALARIPDEQP